ncbi:zinc finger BED domain-containing protein DAYSLEEPER-like [Neltuma alba]|uniref:zinc finger BED domain-containing protein DAYSLEEPER-like n=1 Tax=Neltuma alba TaxID=207710 RepID=UPI0010A443AA|nr:zinc finger BED domain-containing protein DAYSLEEPER-like [Prosopis alba]
MVQDGLGRIRDIIHNIHESVKYITYNDSRLKAFCGIVEQKCLKERKLIIDYPRRWNLTYRLLSTALKFKVVFSDYKEREPHYNYALSEDDWNKVEKICKLLEEFNLAFHVISSSEYPNSNLYLPKVWRVKQVIDNVTKDDKVVNALKSIYDEYASMSKGEITSNNEVDNAGNNSSANAPKLEAYFEDGVYILDDSSNSLNALESWKNNSVKYKILSKMAADVLVIPISTVASESTFSVRGRVIDECHSKLNEESIEAIICGGD